MSSGEQELAFSCPAKGNKCEHCLGIAKAAFTETMAALRPDISADDEYDLDSAAEKVRFIAPLEEDRSLKGIRCDDRQRRAQIIGRHMGSSWAGVPDIDL